MRGAGSILDRWGDAVELADSTARIALDGPIAEMQAIRRDLADIDAPACLENAQGALLASMDATIKGFLLFMQNAPDDDVNLQFQIAVGAMNGFTEILEGVAAEATRESSTP